MYVLYIKHRILFKNLKITHKFSVTFIQTRNILFDITLYTNKTYLKEKSIYFY